MNKTLIVSGGNINKEFAKEYINTHKKQFNNIIAVDKGLEILGQLEIVPNHIVGDFDSIDKDILDKYYRDEQCSPSIGMYKLNQEKDYTDTDIALRLAVELKSETIVTIGATGTRLDHTIANIQNMKIALENNIDCKVVDIYNEIILINKTTKIMLTDNFACPSYKYVSLLPLTETVTGITLKGFKYPLNNKTLKIGESIGISNELIEQEGTIELKEGILIVIKSRD